VRGFTLLELIVVIAILAVLALISISALSKSRCNAAREKAKHAISTCEALLTTSTKVPDIVDCLTKAQDAIDEWKKNNCPDFGLAALVKKVNDRIDEEIASAGYTDDEKKQLKDHKLHD
jgi:prepilin-type N-terminal cleavage/methylation domain-containing protein